MSIVSYRKEYNSNIIRLSTDTSVLYSIIIRFQLELSHFMRYTMEQKHNTFIQKRGVTMYSVGEIISTHRKKKGLHQQDLADGSKVVRFCTSWATTEAEKDQLIRDIRAL